MYESIGCSKDVSRKCLYCFKRKLMGLVSKYKKPIKANESNDLIRTSTMCLYYFKRRWLKLVTKYKKPIKVNESNDLIKIALQCAFSISKSTAQQGWLDKDISAMCL